MDGGVCIQRCPLGLLHHLLLLRCNLLLLLNRHGHAQIDTGQETGAATSFALAIGVHKSLLSKLKGQGPSARDISDAMARQIETRLGLATGWMDALQPDAPLTSAEQSFLDLCLQAYRSTDARGRTELRRQMKMMGGLICLRTLAVGGWDRVRPPNPT